MNRSLAFYGRNEVVASLRTFYTERKNVLIVGPPGIGKTALLRHLNQNCPMLLCETTSSLRRICDNLELQVGWTHYKRNVVERKNRLLRAAMARFLKEQHILFGERRCDSRVAAHTALRYAAVAIDELHEFLDIYAKQLRDWLIESVDALKKSFEAGADIYRIQAQGKIAISEDRSQILEDLKSRKSLAVLRSGGTLRPD